MFVGLSTEITQKPTNTDFHKLEWRKRLCLEQTPLAFVMDPDKGTDSGFIFSLSSTLQIHFFFFFFVLSRFSLFCLLGLVSKEGDGYAFVAFLIFGHFLSEATRTVSRFICFKMQKAKLKAQQLVQTRRLAVVKPCSEL